MDRQNNGVPLEAIRKIGGHADERTTLHNYCFNRLTDEQTYNKVLSALTQDKTEIEQGTLGNTRIISFSQRKNVENSPKIKLSTFYQLCGRWDLNPHERNAHKILSLARLPVPTLPQEQDEL